MKVRTFALIFGIFYTLVGIMGFIPGLVQPPPGDAPTMAMDAGYGYLLGIFPVNLFHNIVHLAAGLWGVFSYGSFGAAKTYSRVIAIVFAVLFVMGLFPGLNTMFGLAPLHGNDIWLHAASAILAGVFGYVVSDRRTDVTM